MKSPLPQTLPKEVTKAVKIFSSFVSNGNNGLDGVIPRAVIEKAAGFAIFTVFKAGFLFSARAGSGIVIARLPNGTWSAPSAIGTAGLGVGGQAGAEMTDFLIVLNSRSAVRSFMSAGSLTLGGNMSLALGPLGRNGEAIGSVNTSGKVAAMYSYSKTRGLFGGVSLEGSVIVERQDANSQAYHRDVTVKMLLSGVIEPPDWASSLIKTLDACTGLPGNQKWIDEGGGGSGYVFGGEASPSGSRNQLQKKKDANSPFPPAAWGEPKNSGSYFAAESTHPKSNPFASTEFNTHFESDFVPEQRKRHQPSLSLSVTRTDPSLSSHLHSRSMSVSANPFFLTSAGSNNDIDTSFSQSSGLPYITLKPGLDKPLLPHEGIARGIALYNFQAVESGDLGFSKGEVIFITQKSNSTDDWWTGKLGGREGIFPANFVEVV
jgi:lipid-binding SYLF domain-containing protein